MKIVHVPYTYYPDAVGGTEIYVEQLADELGALDFENVIFAPGKQDAQYVYQGVAVQRLGVDNDVLPLGELYGAGDEGAAQTFGAFLDATAPDVVHLHAFTRIVSSRMAEQARRRNIPVVFTYHTPTVSCLRSGLMLWGKEPCDGRLDAERCTSCRLHSLGLPKPLAALVARTPQWLETWGAERQGGAWTALRMRGLVAQQHAAFHALVAESNRVVALCAWTRQLLENNAVAREKIVIVPHGLSRRDDVVQGAQPAAAEGAALRVVTLGRLEPIKGVDLLVRAFQGLPQMPIALDVYGIIQSETETPFARQLRADIALDSRIRLLPPVPHEQVVALLRQYDVLAVPSQWFETGPLVVLEAFAAGIPIVGSDLGGIAEKVEDEGNGLLVPSLDVKAWSAAMRRLAQDRALLHRLRANVRPPRSMRMVAQEMAAVYTQVRDE